MGIAKNSQRGNLPNFEKEDISSIKMSTMYRLPPIIPQNMVMDLPTTMYKLPMIQSSNVEPLPTQELSAEDLKELKELEKRQEAILSKLEELKVDVEKLKGGADISTQAVSGLKDFLPVSNCSSRSKADLCVTLIWNSGKETELATSPTSSLLVKGEINFLKHFSRRFTLFNLSEMT